MGRNQKKKAREDKPRVLLQRISKLSRRELPSENTTLVSCNEAFSEARNVINFFKGRLLLNIRSKDLQDIEDIPFLSADYFLYFLPVILETITKYPNSRLTDYVIGLSILPGKKVRSQMSEEEEALSHEVAMYALLNRRNDGLFISRAREVFGLPQLPLKNHQKLYATRIAKLERKERLGKCNEFALAILERRRLDREQAEQFITDIHNEREKLRSIGGR